jgi:hypothetical protein
MSEYKAHDVPVNVNPLHRTFDAQLEAQELKEFVDTVEYPAVGIDLPSFL